MKLVAALLSAALAVAGPADGAPVASVVDRDAAVPAVLAAGRQAPSAQASHGTTDVAPGSVGGLRARAAAYVDVMDAEGEARCFNDCPRRGYGYRCLVTCKCVMHKSACASVEEEHYEVVRVEEEDATVE